MPEELTYTLRDVTAQRAKGGTHFTLSVEELDVPRGAFIAIVGESGCGKSTLLDLLGLVLAPRSARQFRFSSVRASRDFDIANESPASLARIRRHHLGYILQNGGLMPFLTVGSNLLLPKAINQRHAATRHESAEIVSRLGLVEHLGKKPAHLSGGQRQRAAIARAVIQRPEVILADEPTGSVDKITAGRIRDLLLECARERNIAVIIVTHDLKLVEDSADRIYTFRLEAKDERSLHSTLIPG